MKNEYTGTVSGLFRDKGFGFLTGPDGGAYFDRSKIGDDAFDDMTYYHDYEEPITYTAVYVGGSKDSKWHVVEILSHNTSSTKPTKSQSKEKTRESIKDKTPRSTTITSKKSEDVEVGLMELGILLLKILEEIQKITSHIK